MKIRINSIVGDEVTSLKLNSAEKSETRYLVSYNRRNGVALVVTLLMLSVITFVAIAFLAVSRRERASVTGSLNQADAQAMADAALARAQSEISAYLMAHNTNATRPGRPNDLLNYDMMMSHNYINPAGFAPGSSDPTNVNYDVRTDGTLMSSGNQQDAVQNIANLLYDPRAPVFIPIPGQAGLDFRYWLDYNRNGRFESNGPVATTDSFGNANGGTEQEYGEPEWIGALRQPDVAHGSNNNTFIGRYAYLVLPVGKTLDMNYIHNYAKYTSGGLPQKLSHDGYSRNQGHGPWELNLAGFLAGVNSNIWGTTNYVYMPQPTSWSVTSAFNDALSWLTFRYNGNYNLPPLTSIFANAQVLATNGIDEYADGPASTTALEIQPQQTDNDLVNQPWPGSTNFNNFYDPQDLFDQLINTTFYRNLTNAVAQPDTTNRYTFSRLLASIGTDTDPDLSCWVHDDNGKLVKRAKINVNYDNSGQIASYNADPIHNKLTTPGNLTNWDGLTFFTNAAELLLRSQDFELAYTNNSGQIGTNLIHFGVTNIPIYSSTNGNVRYTEAVHRMLQLAANIWDANGNSNSINLGQFPSVFRPIFSQTNVTAPNGIIATNIYIVGYTNQLNASFTNQPFRSLSQIATNYSISPNDNIWGIPLVVGAKKGFPNFNEYNVTTAFTVTRKIKLHRPAPNAIPDAGYQMHYFSISNQCGIEAWNSYPRQYTPFVDFWITNALNSAFVPEGTLPTGYRGLAQFSTNITFSTNRWPGGFAFSGSAAANTFVTTLNYDATLPLAGYVEGKTNFDFDISDSHFVLTPGYPVHQWQLINTNYMFFIMSDHSTGRLIDVVNLGDFVVSSNITAKLADQGVINTQTGLSPNVWDTNASGVSIANSPAPVGVLLQIQIVTNKVTTGDYTPQAGEDSFLKGFLTGNTPTNTDLYMNIPYQPNKVLMYQHSWQANDPLVHYTTESLRQIDYVTPIVVHPEVPIAPTNNSIGKLNTAYAPWDGQNDPPPAVTYNNVHFKDPLIRQSDDWQFPSSKFPSIGWVGRVHRGTPWQTVYLKSDEPNSQYSNWTTNSHWAQTITTYPTNDWRLMDLFTTAITESAARGLVSINQTNLAPWSALLSGIYVLTNNNGGQYIDPSEVPQFVSALNTRRAKEDNGVFHRVGDFLAEPSFTRLSPYLSNGLGETPKVANTTTNWDNVLERIPQSVMSLVKLGDPKFVIYSWGQSLKPANNSLILGGQYRGMCTNYQITGEMATRTVCHLSPDSTPTSPKLVIDSFNILPGN